ncbi:MAG: hypothetical protein GC164_12760 [Phycisphaera sp.]|nr:hypothetical protein [Phycisphaera sp.]
MPRIGLLSDSHGRALTTRRAVATLIEQGAQMLLHLGDVGTSEVIDELVTADAQGQPVPARLVFGNTDWDIQSLTRYAQSVGVTVDHPTGTLELPDDQGTLVFTHGDNEQAMAKAITDKARYLCHGHSHAMLDARKGTTRIINPGALFRARVYSVALLDTQTDSLRFLQLGNDC